MDLPEKGGPRVDKAKYNRQVRYRLKTLGTSMDEFILAGKWEDIDPEEVWKRAVDKHGRVECARCSGGLMKWDTPNYYQNRWYCAQIDHKIPLGPGGHTYDNLQVLCRRCNMRKGRIEKYAVGRWKREIAARKRQAENSAIETEECTEQEYG